VAPGLLTAATVDGELLAFVTGLQLRDLPGPIRERLGLLLRDMAAVCVAGRTAPAAALAAEHAATLHPSPDAALLHDGRRVGVTGAAFANGVLANVLDYDDGHRLTKGHPGAMVIPATLAVAQNLDSSVAEFLAAVAVGYEVAIRAGIALHERDPSYHASGSWGSVGVAAAASRLLGLDGHGLRAALGLAEYHAPIGHIMRSCADPQMTKDACAWGATVGVSSALLAARGFTGTRPEFLETPLDDLGSRWRLAELYIKAYPCCRWSQGAIVAALDAAGGEALDPADVRQVRVRTFAAADGLAKTIPTSTEVAQYSLHWPVACALARGRFGVQEVLGSFDDPAIVAMFELITVIVDPELTDAFPARRLTAVEIELADGTMRSSGPVQAAGEPEDPGLDALVATKVRALVGLGDVAHGAAPERGMRDRAAPELLALLCDAGTVLADA